MHVCVSLIDTTVGTLLCACFCVTLLALFCVCVFRVLLLVLFILQVHFSNVSGFHSKLLILCTVIPFLVLVAW